MNNIYNYPANLGPTGPTGPPSVLSTEVADQVVSLAPLGQRDLWQVPTTAPSGSQLKYWEDLDLVLSFGNATGANAIYYSSDQGVNYTACTFDVPPANILIVSDYNGTVAVALSSFTNPCEVYTSPDGINWTQQANIAYYIDCLNIIWYEPAGLFVTGNQTALSRIITSPDGITWTLRTAEYQAVSLCNNGSKLVSVGPVNYMYSSNATTWNNSASVTESTRAVCYSSENKEWVSAGYTTGIVYSSTDGETWTSNGVLSPVSVNYDCLIYVADSQRYYIAKADTDGNYSLWSSPDSSTVFVGTHLDGAVVNLLSYSLLYLSAVSRFIIGTNAVPIAVYSTARNDLKVLSDNIRVRNSPVSVSQYCTYANVSVTNTLTETDISASASALGSLSIQDSTPLGMCNEFDLNLALTSTAGDTLTIRYKINGSTVLTHTLTVPALASSLPVNIKTTGIVQATNIQLNSIAVISGLPTHVAAAVAYTRTVINTWSITAQWAANVNNCVQNSLIIKTHFRNGA